MQPFGGLYCQIDVFDGRAGATCVQAAGSIRIRSGWMTLHSWGKYRKISLFGSLAFLGLAFCVFAWGLEYKLSLYDSPQTAFHQIPKAKLLSRDEQSSTAEHPLVIRSKTSTSVIYTAPTAVFLILLLAIRVLNPPVSRRVEKRANKLLHLHRSVLNTLFVRPPPVLA